MTNLKDYLTDMAKEAISRHELLKIERDELQAGDYEVMIEDLVDETLTNIITRLIQPL